MILENLEEADLIVEVIREYSDKPPYELLKKLCEGLAMLPDFSIVSGSINAFIKVKKLQWTRRFQRSENRKRQNTFEIVSVILS